MDLSIVIPIWNEESKIGADILNIDSFFRKSALKIELIVVDDGSSDNSLLIIQKALQNVSIESNSLAFKHKGKGHAVGQGMLASKGNIVMFMDCGGNVPLSFINKGMEILREKDADIILGSRFNKLSKITYDRSWFRKIASTLFRKMVHKLLNLPPEISDTQCGFKLFKGELAREIFADLKLDGFLFDLEMILLAKVKGYNLREMPVEWHCDRDSRLSVPGALFPVLRDLFYLRKI